ncbi:acetyl-CoA synthetase-like protein [Xylariaceae sp. FL0662B]|nr:acetyl-CoA synthetase-like protein [Xylariaceae sp. FL0662B]
MVVKSLHEDIEIPNLDLWTYLFEREDKPFPDDKEIYIDPDTGRSYTWAQAKSAALEFGKGLKSRWGFKHGDALGFFSPNNVDYAPVFFGVLWAGGACSTANPTYTVEELEFQMKDSGVKGIVTQLPLLPTVLKAVKAIGLPEDRVLLLGDGRDPSGKFKHFSEIRDAGLPGGSSRPRIDPRTDIAFLVYSSGTTGFPKGVMLTHYNIVANLAQLEFVDRFNGLYHSGGPDGKGDKQLAVLPFFHVYGLTCIALLGIRMGLQVVVLPRFELEKACKVIQDRGITFLSIPPPVVLALAKHPAVSKYDLSSVKWMNSGAAPLGRDLVEQVWQRLTIPVMQGYGLSETAPTLTKAVVADWARHNGSCGKLLPNVEAKIVGLDDGRELADPGAEGELWVRGPNVFPGYLNRPDLRRDTFSPDGFFKTGDIAYVDAKGNFYITDRLKELIKYKGFQVAPAELEGLLLGHPEITDACVVPAHDPERETEVPRAYVVLRGGGGMPRGDEKEKEKKAAEIASWLDAKVAQHKRLRGGVRFVDEIPKNASGKLLRRVLKDRARQEDHRAAGPKL